MYKALISLIMILVMSASIGSGAPVEFEVVVDEAVASNTPETEMLGMSFVHAVQWQLASAEVGGEYCDF